MIAKSERVHEKLMCLYISHKRTGGLMVDLRVSSEQKNIKLLRLHRKMHHGTAGALVSTREEPRKIDYEMCRN